MGRLFLLLTAVWATVLAGCATTGQNAVTVFVTGVGSTPEEARRAAFRDAIQLAQGSLNLSERRVVNDELFEDDVSYARGVIDSFTEASRGTDPADGQHYIQMSVTVSPTAIQRRLLATQSSSAVSGKDIGRQIDVAQQQIRSEVDRYIAARKLFEHVTRDMANSLFDVTTGDVETARNGGEVSTTVALKVSLNPDFLNSICLAGREYQNARTEAVPEQYKKNMGFIYIRHPSFFGCLYGFAVERAQMQRIVLDLENSGICLRLEDDAGQHLRQLFYQSKPMFDKLPYLHERDAIEFLTNLSSENPGVYLIDTFTDSDVDYDVAVALWPPAFSQVDFGVTLPPLPDSILQRLSKITAVSASEDTCT